MGTFRLNQQSAFYQNQGELFHFHNAQVQLGSKGFQWITRGMYSSNGMARASSQATYKLGRHSISLRNQRAIVKAGTQSHWLGQYYWRTSRSNFSLSAQHLMSGWNFRSYGGCRFARTPSMFKGLFFPAFLPVVLPSQSFKEGEESANQCSK